MADRDLPDSGQTFRIGTVSRLTGVPTDTLRVWERRYHVVTPVRSEAGTRHYAAEDVGRLSLIKRLVDGGDAISSVANLSLEDLRERIRGAELPERFSSVERACRVVVCGHQLAGRLKAETIHRQGVDFVGLFGSPEELTAAKPEQTADVLVLELPTLQAERLREIGPLLHSCGAERALVIYGFATRSALSMLDAARMIARRAPVDLDTVCQECVAMSSGLGRAAPERQASVLEGLGASPPRRFDDGELARLAAVSSEGDCDWSRHLVDLVSALTAFETFSAECIGRGSEDPALIAYIGACTARARSLMETALERTALAGEQDPALD
ncbi:MerR family transcriptional regulator [Thiorhodococcus minor]|uniref:MerR family transcriptional regulator n=1 Tax=Thiorhodococcus minor TaxID=57489 RepID=UPI001FD84257|nr:MerR family transcriptional regulator [Thiorhodococcus minor]